MKKITGYAHETYANSLAEFGSPYRLEHSRGWVLERTIPGMTDKDAMGCYPLFCCGNWSGLKKDLESIGKDLVSLSLVTDPFGQFDLEVLRKLFPVCFHYKDHFVADLSRPLESFVRKRYQRYIKSNKDVEVYYCEEPLIYLEEWVNLYQHLVERHKITGIRAFSKKCFETLFGMPGLRMFRAVYQGRIIGAILWVVEGEVGYAHLMAIHPRGYDLKTGYMLWWESMRFLSHQVSWADFGAAPGLRNVRDGLAQYKQAWATAVRPVYFCGSVFDQDKYDYLVNAIKSANPKYFPAYRFGEFG